MNCNDYIEKLNMKPHPEGGYFLQTYLSDDKIGNQQLFSSIIFLLKTGEVSHFHRLKEDELWYFHDGESLDIVEITIDGKLVITSLGKHIDKGEKLQYLVKKGSIFGSIMKNDGYSVVGCMVSLSFTYEHFELLKRSELIKLYPQYEKIIIQLTYDN
ncbi:MAG: cupin domain-containing protein [Erysipelotrichaceae bacterium]|nr:cupin domain-containing protein [Erysipelotrichaceae bacterium]